MTQNLVPLLDGKTPTRVLIERLARLAASGAIKLEERGARVDDPKRARELLETVVSDALLRLGRSALLEG